MIIKHDNIIDILPSLNRFTALRAHKLSVSADSAGSDMFTVQINKFHGILVFDFAKQTQISQEILKNAFLCDFQLNIIADSNDVILPDGVKLEDLLEFLRPDLAPKPARSYLKDFKISRVALPFRM